MKRAACVVGVMSLLSAPLACPDDPQTETPNLAPVVTAPSLEAEEGVAYSEGYSYTDPENDPVTYSPVVKPAWLEVAVDGVLSAASPVAGEHPLELLVNDGKNTILQSDTLRVFLNYANSYSALNQRGQEYVSAFEFLSYDMSSVPLGLPVGGLDDPVTPGYDNITVFVDAIIVTSQGVKALYSETFVPHIGPANVALLQDNFYDVIELEVYTSASDARDAFDAAFSARGFTPP